MSDAILLLADGSYQMGQSFGAEGEVMGEVVFNTSMTGYQEILTDLSYYGQMVVMTYPLIGNYGINEEDIESGKIGLGGLIVKEHCPVPSHWKSKESLGAYLRRNHVVAIEGIDTRAVTRRIRTVGAMMGILSTTDFDQTSLMEKLKATPSLTGMDWVSPVTCKAPYLFSDGKAYHVVVYDFGVKYNILRMLSRVGFRVTVVPAQTSAEEVLSFRPDGVLLSNGPGDPEALYDVIKNTRKLMDKKPIFGICLGHQILGLALGGRCYKMKFGHHGGNHPVMETATGKIRVTAQNHGFVMDYSGIEREVQITHINLNDRTVEGMQHNTYPVYSLQFHPEASPGPHDGNELFGKFVNSVKGGQ